MIIYGTLACRIFLVISVNTLYLLSKLNSLLLRAAHNISMCYSKYSKACIGYLTQVKISLLEIYIFYLKWIIHAKNVEIEIPRYL